MSAKEMFEELGYECKITETLGGKKLITYSEEEFLGEIGVSVIITFYKEIFTIRHYYIEAGRRSKMDDGMGISYDLLQAINKQVEELRDSPLNNLCSIKHVTVYSGKYGIE